MLRYKKYVRETIILHIMSQTRFFADLVLSSPAQFTKAISKYIPNHLRQNRE